MFLNSTMRDRARAIFVCCLIYLCGCASDRILSATDQHIDNRNELLRRLGPPDKITEARGGSEWSYSSRGFNLFHLRSWNCNAVYRVDENGKVTLDELNGASRQYHLTPVTRLPRDFEEFAGTPWPEDASLNAHHLAGAEYVVVGDVAYYYGLGRNRSGSRRRAMYQAVCEQLTLEANQREIQINGVQRRLNTPVLYARGELWVTPEDVTTIIDPVFRAGHSRKPLLIHRP